METDNRKEQIIKAALKRFSHFGIGKTTMNEIAEDSSISKGNIYYYFADKNALVTEVVYELLHQFEELVQKRIEECSSTLEALQRVQDTKKEFFEKYYMLNIFEGIDYYSSNENLKNITDAVSKFALKLIVGIFKKGIQSGELSIPDLNQTAELYIQATGGIAMINQTTMTKRIGIDYQLMDSIHHKQMELAKIFIKALSHH